MNNEIKEILEFKENADYKKLSCDELAILKDYITNLQQENEHLDKAIEDIEFCLNSINQEKEMSIDLRTRNEMESCIQVLNGTLNTLRGEDNDN